jgi:hypothetical protein
MESWRHIFILLDPATYALASSYTVYVVRRQHKVQNRVIVHCTNKCWTFPN